MFENVSHTITTLFGVVMVVWMGSEIGRRRKHLRELYDVLGKEDKHIVADLDRMVELGQIKPYKGHVAATMVSGHAWIY